MTIRDLDPTDRPRERLWEMGPGALADRELIALLLRSGGPGRSALASADDVLSTFGGLHGLARALPEEIAALPNLGRAKAASLVAAFEFARRLSGTAAEPLPPVRAPEDIARLVLPRLRDARRETVLLVVLDGAHRCRRIEELSRGSASRSLLDPRDVLNAVLRNDGVGFALAHNHPSGDLTPSAQDAESTARIAEAAEVVGLRFLDHVILTADGWLSLANAGLMRTAG